jgi:L-2-hydroxyglutarate oxidase LhgO
MEQVNILVIGAGVVGLSVGYQLSKKFEDVVVVDKEDYLGRHTSSRNSEVIHSGLYYVHGSLKHKLCVRGNELMYQFCEENNVPYKNCGKLIVATDEEELPYLEKLIENGKKNGVKDMVIFDKEKTKELEPSVKAIKSLYVPSTGIVDTHKFMEKLAYLTEENDGFVVYDMEVTSIEKTDDGYIVSFSNGEKYLANYVINSAGLFSDKIAEMVGIDTEENKLKIHWCKGEYYKTTKIKNVEHLIYPLPDPKGIYLGIHLTINLNGEVRFGPNAYYVDKLDYKMDETYKEDFFKAVNKYLDIEMDQLQMDDTGIRPKLQGPNDDFRDFYIKEESDKGLPNFINLIGIESPGLTSALAIAEEVEKFIK